VKIIGTIIVGEKFRPFIFDDEKNELILDEFSWERDFLPNLLEKIDLRIKIRQLANFLFDDIRFGEYFCESCKNWRKANNQEWSYGMCLSCSLDRDSEFSANYD
jgi:hypothetical protein